MHYPVINFVLNQNVKKISTYYTSFIICLHFVFVWFLIYLWSLFIMTLILLSVCILIIFRTLNPDETISQNKLRHKQQ